MNTLLSVPTVLLGPAAMGAAWPTTTPVPGGGRWRATWTMPSNERVQATAAFSGDGWSAPAPVRPGDEPANAASASQPAEGLLAHTFHGGSRLALRTRRRVPGVRPSFPSAGLVISRMVAGHWQDVAFADDVPDGEIMAAAVSVEGDHLLAVYLVADGRGGATCRALRLSLATMSPITSHWRHLPDFPLQPGVAAVMAGVSGGALIAAGGANFPDLPPWEGGVKKTYDEIFALPAGATAWQPAGRLAEPRAYAAMVSVPEGVLAIGGENAAGFFQDVVWLNWDGRQVTTRLGPALPQPVASPVAAVLEGKIYLAGGYAAGPPRVSTTSFLCLDLGNTSAGWQTLPSWPGPSRALAVIAALNGAIYLFSGLEMSAGPDGQPQMNYLTDAYRYRPGGSWEKLPDLPWSVIAAPSPAPVTMTPERIFVFGGVDGRQVGKTPRDLRVPEDILYFDVARHEWRLWVEAWPEPVVSTSPVPVGTEWIFVSGEIKAGHRTTAVRAWRPGF
jgi:N-acetylneuraminate epimerase